MSRLRARPFLVRVAGLTGSALTRLRSPELLAQVEQWLLLTDRRALARSRLADELHSWIGSAEATERRELLALRRDCHNGRPLEKYRSQPLWKRVMRDSSNAPEVVDLEAQLERLRETLAQTFQQQRERALEVLLDSAVDPGFRRGLALASPALSKRLEGTSGISNAKDLNALPARRRRKMESSLLRYVSRGAAKLSPYSTLTRVAIGQLVGEELESPIHWPVGRWHEHSLLRSRRYLTEQLVEAWQRHPAVRRQLALVVNPSIERIGDQLRYLRPPAWRIDEAGCLKTRPLKLARTEAGAVTAEVLALVDSGNSTVVDLVDRLATSFEIDPARAKALVDKMIDLGLVSVRLPWDDSCDVLEAELLEGLRRLGGPRSAVDSLEALLAAQRGFLQSRDPAATLREVVSNLESAWEALAPGAGFEGLALWRPHANELFEDVIMKPEDPSGPGVLMSEVQAEATLDALNPWLQLSFLTDQRFDFLHTVTAAMHASRPGADSLTLLDLYSEIQPLWRQFVAHERQVGDAWDKPFNPLDLPAIRELGSLRNDLFQRLHNAAERAEGGSIPSAVITEIVAHIPLRYRVPVEPCAFVQPADKRGEQWVVNQIFEGTGRFSTRYASLLAGDGRRRFLEAFQQRSIQSGEPGAVALMDLPWNHGDNLAVHPASTRLALVTPGENFDPLSPSIPTGYEQVLAPPDLRVLIPAAPEELPDLVGCDGRRLTAVHLGGVAARFLPSWLQFVSLWGPRGATTVLPAASWRRERGIEVSDRWTVGGLIIRRKRWRSPGAVLLARVGRADLKGFLGLHQWLRDVGIPDRVFFIEKTIEGDSIRRKPQYLDFSCPLFVELLQRSIRGGNVIFEEALPVPDDFPLAYDREPRAQEIQLDALALRGPSPVE